MANEKGFIAPLTPESVGEEAMQKGMFPTEAFEFTEPGNATPTLTLKEGWKLTVAGDLEVSGASNVAPVGAIVMFGAATAPSGWLACDNTAVSRTTYAALFAVIGTTYGTGDGSTTFNLPDFRGIFPRGSGTSAKLTNANGAAFASTLGTYQNDQMQGHWHGLHLTVDDSGQAIQNQYVMGGNSGTAEDMDTAKAWARAAITDTTNGTPRVGTETNPANLSINFIIKY